MRDQAQQFSDAGCRVVGISFDSAADNAAFATKHDFPFSLLCDTDKSVGSLYDVLRDADDPFADYPKRISYLINPDGMIAASYEVSDPAGHGTEVLTDLAALQS